MHGEPRADRFRFSSQYRIDALMHDSSARHSAIRVIRRSASKSIREAEAGGALVLDLTSKSDQPSVQFSGGTALDWQAVEWRACTG